MSALRPARSHRPPVPSLQRVNSVPGVRSMMLGYALLGLQPLAVGALAGALSAPAVVLARFGFALLAVALICLLRGRWLTTGQPGLLALRGLLGGVAVLAYFGSIQLAGAGRGTVLNYTYPIWANVFAWFFLKERPSVRFWLALLVAVGGVALLAWPEARSAKPEQTLGQFLGIGSALFAGAAVVCIKKLRDTDEALTIIFAFSLLGALIAAPAVWLVGVAPQPLAGLPWQSTGPLLLAVGALSFFGHVFFTRGYRGTSVQTGSLLSLSVPLIAAACSILFLGEELTPRFAVGSALILLALASLGLRRAPSAPPPPLGTSEPGSAPQSLRKSE